MKTNGIFRSVMLLTMCIALMGCAPQIVTVTVVVTATPPPIQATQTVPPTATVAVASTSTLEASTATVTASQVNTQPANTATATPTPTPTNVPVFDYCGSRKNPDLCITSLGTSSSQIIYMIFQYTNNNKSEEYYLMFDNSKYDCAQITNLPNLYTCKGMPNAMSRTVNVQLFKSAGDVLVAQGSIYLDPTYLYTYTPTPTPTPTPTSTPTITPTPSLTPSATP